MPDDEHWMRRALDLAARAAREGRGAGGRGRRARRRRDRHRGRTRRSVTPTPPPHAEIKALRAASRAAGNYRLPGTDPLRHDGALRDVRGGDRPRAHRARRIRGGRRTLGRRGQRLRRPRLRPAQPPSRGTGWSARRGVGPPAARVLPCQPRERRFPRRGIDREGAGDPFGEADSCSEGGPRGEGGSRNGGGAR